MNVSLRCHVMLSMMLIAVSGYCAGVGGQIDFIRGAALSEDGEGKPIIALPSTTARGASKIVPYIKQGMSVA